MNKKKLIMLFIMILLVFTLTGCALLSPIIDAILGNAIQKGVNKAYGKDIVYSNAYYIMSLGFYFGGGAYYYDDYKAGEGTRWEVIDEDIDKNKESPLIVEKALLKKTKDKMLWKIIYTEEGDVFNYELLMDYDLNILEIWTYDSSEEQAIHYTYYEEYSEQDQDGNGSQSSNSQNESDWKDYYVGNEKLVIGGKTYTCKYYKIPVKDQGTDLLYEYWMADQVPGKIVRFKYTDLKEKEFIQSTMVEYRSGYKAEYSDF